MRIGRKLAVTHLVMSLFLVGLVFGAKLVIDRIDRDVSALSDQTFLIIDQLNDLRSASLRILATTNEIAFIAGTDKKESDAEENEASEEAEEDELEELDEGIETFNKAFTRYSQTIEEFRPDSTETRDEIGAAGTALVAGSLRLAAAVEEEGSQTELLDIKEDLEDLERAYLATIATALDLARFDFERQKIALSKITEVASTLTWAGSAFFAVLLLIVGNLVTKTITRPLDELVIATERMTQGDFSTRVDVASQDEVGRLGAAFNQLGQAIEEHIQSRAESESELKYEIEDRLKAEATLKELNDNLEGLIAERTEAIRRSEAALLDEKERAETASQAKSAFLANMSHELRTPLNAIIGYSEMMLEDAIEDGAQERVSDLQKIQRSGRHLLELINDILDISKIEAGKIELNIDSIDLTNLIAEVESTTAPLMEANGNQLKIALPDDLGRVECDDQRLRQVLINLLSNAAKFTENGAIGLIIERNSDGWIRIAVRDNGIGMSEEQISRLFEPFIQADNTITKRYGGTGLGLAISLRFVEMMGGRITIDSELGAGSCFTVWLPDFAVSDPDSSEADDGPLILIIEDTLTDSSLLERYLRPLGYRIALARDGEQGLELARKINPAAIILDLELPGMDGFTVLKALRTDMALRTIPIIVTSIHDAREQVLELGAWEYITKPIDRPALTVALSEHIQHPNTTDPAAHVPIPAQAANG